MNGSVKLVESLPFSLLDNLYITTKQAWLVMLLVSSLVLLFQYKRFHFLLLAFVFAGCISIDQWMHYRNTVNKKEMFVYRIPGHQAIDLMAVGTTYFVADSALLRDEEKIRFHIRPNRLRKEVKEEVFPEVENTREAARGCRFIVWEGKAILLIEAKNAVIPALSVDLLVISNYAITLRDIQKKIIFEKLIVDSSNSFYFADKLMKEAEQMQINAHSVLHQGYFSQRL
jgi:competence protein ComEC